MNKKILLLVALFFGSYGFSYADQPSNTSGSKPTSIFDNAPDYKKFNDDWQKQIQQQQQQKDNSTWNKREPLKDTVINNPPLESVPTTPPEQPSFFESLPFMWRSYIVIFILAILFVLFLSVLLFIFKRSERKHRIGNGAIEILQKRYASGEIDKETFNSISKELRK